MISVQDVFFPIIIRNNCSRNFKLLEGKLSSLHGFILLSSCNWFLKVMRDVWCQRTAVWGQDTDMPVWIHMDFILLGSLTSIVIRMHEINDFKLDLGCSCQTSAPVGGIAPCSAPVYGFVRHFVNPHTCLWNMVQEMEYGVNAVILWELIRNCFFLLFTNLFCGFITF